MNFLNQKKNKNLYFCTKSTTLKSKVKQLIEKEIEAIKNIPIDGVIEKAVDILYENIHLKQGKLVIIFDKV